METLDITQTPPAMAEWLYAHEQAPIVIKDAQKEWVFMPRMPKTANGLTRQQQLDEFFKARDALAAEAQANGLTEETLQQILTEPN